MILLFGKTKGEIRGRTWYPVDTKPLYDIWREQIQFSSDNQLWDLFDQKLGRSPKHCEGIQKNTSRNILPERSWMTIVLGRPGPLMCPEYPGAVTHAVIAARTWLKTPFALKPVKRSQICSPI